MFRSYEDLVNERIKMLQEIAFLKQRNSDLRKKSYIQVYDENLKLIDENKALKHENEVKFNDLVKYEKIIIELRETLKVREEQLSQSAKIADGFYTQLIETEKENRHLKDVIQSVETFVNQFTR